MLRSKLLLALVFGVAMIGHAQTITKYTFSAYSGTFTNLSGGTSPNYTAGSSDEGYFNNIPIGFDFWYMGTRYTTLSASTNGWLTLGNTIAAATPLNNLTSGGVRPTLAVLWDDLEISPATKVNYLTSGTVGSRVFTIQYVNVRWQSTANGNTISFHVKLYEGTGKIEFQYRQESGGTTTPSASIGISASGTGSGNFLSVNNAGTSVSSTTEASVTAKPITGNTYAFTPPVPTAPANLLFTSVSDASMTLNWSDLSTNELGFVIYRSTDGVNYTFASQVAANATSSVQSGLTASTTYYWRVYALTEGGLSTALSGTQAATCTPPSPPTVTSPVNYCQGASASALTATGSNLLWGGVAGSVGGTTALTNSVYVDPTLNNRKTNFSTLVPNVTITSVDYYITSWQTVLGLTLSIYNSSGTVIATSTTSTSLTAGSSNVKVTNTFNYTITAAGDYSIGISSGSGNIGSESSSFPLVESTNTVKIIGVSSIGYRCFTNIQFSTPTSASAPVPSTATAGATNYYVSQTVAGCRSALATITVNVNAPNLSQIPTTDLAAHYRFSGDVTDATGNLNGIAQNSPTLTTDRFNVANSAYSFNGSSQYITTPQPVANPQNFTISIWFKTNTTTGGKLIGFGSNQTGLSYQYDRHLYMANSGQIYFGVYPGSVFTLNSPLAYNDNAWHLATATLSSSTGMALYMDGALVASNPSVTAAETATSYWRIGYDNMNGWTSQPSNFYFTGALDDVLIYNRALSGGEVATLYNTPYGAGNNGPTCVGSTVTLSAITVSGASYSWTGPSGFTSSLQNPSFTYTTARAGTYAVQVTSGGCSATAYTNLASASISGQWSGGVSTDWATAGNWCSGAVPTATTDVVISATASQMPLISTSVSVRNLTLQTGATLTTALAGTLNITGSLTNLGTMTNNGTTNFSGTSGQQTFSGVTSFYNLTVSNSSGLSLPATTTVSNNLTISTGTITTNNFGLLVGGNWTNNASTAALIPGTGTVTFNGTGAQAIGGTFATSFNNLTVTNTGNTVSLNVNANVGGNLTINSGTLNLGAFTANRTTAGGTITVANNATLKIEGTNTYPSNYGTHQLSVASNVEYAGTNQTVASQTYGNLIFSSSSGAAVKTLPGTPLTVVGNLSSVLGTGTSVTYTAAAAISVSGNVSIGASTTFNGGSFSHNVGGNWVTSGTFNGNTSTVTLNGTGTSVSGAGSANFNNLTIAASGVSFAASTITLSGNLATQSSGSFSQVSGGTLVMTGTNKTISGSGISLDNLTVSGTVSTTSSLELTGHLSVSGTLTSNFSTITMSGASKTISGAGTKNFSTLSVTGSIGTAVDFFVSSALLVSGSITATAGTANFIGTSTVSGAPNLYDVTINGTALQLSGNSILGIANSLTITSGTLDVSFSTPNTVNFNGTGGQNVNAITYNNLNLSGGGTKTASGAFTVNNSITIGSGTTFVPGAFTHSVQNDWNNNGTFTAGSSTIQFIGAATSNIRGATTFNILTINQTTMTTQVILESNISVATVNMTNGMITTGSNTLTITTTRTGNGKILGTINRTHAFAAGNSYAFDGPNNYISFAAASGVTSVIMTIAEEPIGDFPFGGSINKWFDISIPAGTYTATLRLDYEEDELNGNTESTLSLWNYNGSWANVGKTANSTTSNYVEFGPLTSISNRWTLSGQSNQVRWNGSISSDWHTAANWTVISGAASRPPSASDIVELGTAAFLNQPTISASAVAKNIHFGSVQAVTLTLANGGSLTTSGNIDGTWSSNMTHTIDVGNQTMNVQGDFTLSDGTNGHRIHLTIGSGTVDVDGSFTQSGDANLSFSGAGTLSVFSNLVYEGSGSFSPGTGTVIFDGNANQHVAHVNYYNFTVNKTGGIARIDEVPSSIGGNLTISAGELDILSQTTVAGNVTIASGATLQNSDILEVGGNWLNSGTFAGEGIHVKFNGSGTQTISPSTFNNLIIDKPVGSSAVLTGNVSVKDNLTVTSGTLNISTFTCDRVTPGGTLILDANATYIVSANNSPVNFANGFLATTSTVIADGVVPQYILGLEFGNLILRNSGLKTLVVPILVKGDLTIESGATFDGGSETLTLLGNWINNGTFVPSAGTVVANGTSKTLTGVTTFNRFIANGSYTIQNDVTFNTLLNITASGSLLGGASLHVTMNGDLINSGILRTLGTTTFTGNVLQTLSLINAVETTAITVNFNGSVSPVLNSTSAPQYGYLNINNTGGLYPSVGWTIAYALTVGSGASFNGGISTHTLLGSLTNNGTITSSGTFNFTPASSVVLDFGTDFTSTGTVTFGGAGAITLAGTPVGFRNVLISNSNAAGVSPSSNWTLANTLTINAGSTLHAGSYTHTLAGRINNLGTLDGGTSTFVLNGTVAQEIRSPSPSYFYHLTLNKASAAAFLSTSITVNGTLTFIKGQLQTLDYVVSQPSTGTITGAAQNTGWVNGKLQKNVAMGATLKTFEIGDGSYYTPISLLFSSVTTGGDLTLSTTAGDHPLISSSSINSSKNVNRYWSFVNSGIEFAGFAATFNFVAADVDAGANTSAFKVAVNDGLSWTQPSVASPNATNIEATSVVTMGDFVIGENCNAGTVLSYDNSPYCSNAGSALATLVGNTGGTFTSSSNLSLNSSTGSINLGTSTPGTYVVTYTVGATTGCASYFTTGDITITAAPDATISYANDSLCSSSEIAAATLIGTPGGSYGSTAGIILDATSGNVDLLNSTAGTYTISYSIAAGGGCAAYSTSTDLTITTQPFATGTYEGNPYCSNGGIAFPTGTAVGLAGTLTSTAGLVIDPSTGVVDLGTSTPGTYTVTYNVPAHGGCNAYSNTATIAITAAPSATISYTGSPYMLSNGIATVTLVGTTGGTYSSTVGLSLNSSSGDVTLITTVPDTYTVTYTIPEANGCDEFLTTANITVTYNSKTWDGGAVTNFWSDANNWDPDGVPTAVDNILLDGPYTIQVDVAAITRHLTLDDPDLSISINGGNTLAVEGDLTLSAGTLNTGNSNTQNLTLTGNWVNNGGTFEANANTVGFVGTVPQTIRGTSVTDFYNISATNTAGISVESSQNMIGALSLAENCGFDADGSNDTSVFTLISTADNPTQDAAIGILPSGASVTGNVRIQRFMTKVGGSNFRIYRYFSSPVQNGAVSDLQNEIPVTGPFTGSSACAGCQANASMFYYDESILNDWNSSGTADYNDGYIRFPTSSNTEIMEKGRGYAVFVRGNILASTLWDLNGIVNTGNVSPISHPVNFTSSGNIANDGWNLVGNPFPSAIDWNASSGWTKTNIDATIYVTDNRSGSTQHAAWNGVVGTNGGSRYIAMGQGFWVKANAASPILQSNENTKSPRTETTFFREEALSDLLRITLSKGSVHDEAVIHFRQDASAALDPNADALKLKNQTFNISSFSNSGESLAINSWSELLCSTSIRLGFSEVSTGSYGLEFNNLSSFSDQVHIFLKDQYLNRSILVGGNSTYTFEVTTDSNSFGNNRFLLQFDKPSLSVPITEKEGILSIDYTDHVQWYLNGSLIEGATQSSIKKESNGQYGVVVQYKGCELKGSTSPLITTLLGQLPVGVSVYPNPVTSEFFVETKNATVQSISLESLVGTTLSHVVLSDEDRSQKIRFAVEDYAAGTYLLKITTGEKTFIKKIIKK